MGDYNTNDELKRIWGEIRAAAERLWSAILQVTKDLYSKLSSDEKLVKILKKSYVTFVTIFILLVISTFFFYMVPAMQEISFTGKKTHKTATGISEDPDYRKQISALTREIQRLSRKYDSFTSGQSYIVINTTDNRFFLYRNKKLIREGFCSSGSYTMLKTEGERKWIFKTPKGKYRILGKIASPVWRKPDWAFVEEGLPVPPADHPSRYEYGVLGDYALSIGDGYLIHGTLYKRFLGMPVTHGCVRLNDEDLEAVYKNLSVGSKVYIF